MAPLGTPMRIVARYRDGRVIKGYSKDFDPGKPFFYLFTVDNRAIQAWFKDLKAVFFVKTFEGNPEYIDKKAFGEDNVHLRPHQVRVLFTDGEVMVGSAPDYVPGRMGFYLTPADAGCNHSRVFIVASATKLVGADGR